jgi:NADH dehydrogenase FAD-containing subunit
MLSKILFFTRFLLAALPIMIERFMQSLRARIHRLTYRAVDNPRNIVIIGGSFGGFFLAQRLANSVPTGYRVVLVEKKSHFNFTWIFPRVSVVAGHEHKAFIPYGPGVAAAPAGSLVFRQALATAIDDKTVELQDGSKLDYDYLAIATGSTGSPPWNFTTGEKRDGMGVFRDMQQRIRDAKDLVVVGGGAVGVELATDAKSKYPEKNVSLIHSRERVMNTFGPKLHEYAMERMNLLGVNVHLGERVPEKAESEAPSVLTLKSGKTVPYDVLVSRIESKPGQAHTWPASHANVAKS